MKLRKIIAGVAASAVAASSLAVAASAALVVPENTEKEDEIVGADAVALYYSLKTEGFEKYIESFPTEWRTGLQRTLEYTDEQFAEAIANETETVYTLLQDEYEGAEFYIEYEFIGEREIPEDEYSVLIDELSNYLYMSTGTIEDIKAQIYSVHTYGVNVDGYVVKDDTTEEELYMLNITGEGWKVSPHEYKLF